MSELIIIVCGTIVYVTSLVALFSWAGGLWPSREDRRLKLQIEEIKAKGVMLGLVPAEGEALSPLVKQLFAAAYSEPEPERSPEDTLH